jgi:hypothetical protein
VPISALEINDSGLVLLGAGVEARVSPGIALVDDRQLLLGDAALKQSRLRPGNVNNRFWELLNLDPLGNRTRDVRTAADLAYSHLKSFWQPGPEEQEVILVLPGVYSNEQLGLLLGITNECGIPVTGLVDTAVAGSRFSAPDRHLVHLDVHLHRLVLSEMEEGQLIRRNACESIASAGLAQLADLWCNRIADAFVRHTRFDPMHQAESEQMLHDRLPGWLSIMEAQGSAMLELESRGRKYQLMYKRDQLVQASKELFAQVAEQIAVRSRGAGTLVQLTHRARALPGLVDALGNLDDCEVAFLEPHASPLGALHFANQIRGQKDALRFVTSLPWEPQEVLSPVARKARPVQRGTEPVQPPLATHVVLHGIAYTASPVLIFVPDDGGRFQTAGKVQIDTHPAIRATGAGLVLSSHGNWLINGQPAAPDQALRAGDQVQLADGSEIVLAISMESGHG